MSQSSDSSSSSSAGTPPLSITIAGLAAKLGMAKSDQHPVILDVRRAPAFEAASHTISGALRIAPDALAAAIPHLSRARPVIACCVHGHEVSQNAARALIDAGIDASFLEGGITAWSEAGQAVMPKPAPWQADAQ